MKGERRRRIQGKVLAVVVLAGIAFIAAGIFLGAWSAGEMREMVADQFNEEQLVMARHVATLIEREIGFLRKELLFLRKMDTPVLLDPEAAYGNMQRVFSRFLESGVWKIELLDLRSGQRTTFMPYKKWVVTQAGSEQGELPPPGAFEEQRIWISRPVIKPFGLSLLLGTMPIKDPSRIILFHVNLSWFLSPFLRDIRSGKTGYAWLIDGRGIFLFHPNTDFIGKSAFEIREEAYPDVPLGIINFIQKEKMLKGRIGTGWYYSGWHRGITGKIKKLIAYCPAHISENPVQTWSVALAAPISEIEDAVRKGMFRQFLLQGLTILVIVLGGATILVFELRWSRTLENRVARRTEDLKKSEEKYRSLVESAEDFIYTVDSKGVFLSMNSFTANFFGGSPGDFIGKGLSGLFPERVLKKQLQLIGLVYRYGKSVRDEFEIEIGGHETWISANFMPLKGEDGKVNAVLCIARDITESKILERQLINAEKLASMGTLAAGVAHEINNPLGVILGFCELLLRKSEQGSQAYEDLKTIERQGLHCKEVVENLLSFARIEKGTTEYSDLNQSLEEILKVVRHTLEMNDIELVLDLASSLPGIRADSRQLQQVFLNLINNAISAMEGGGRLMIRTYLERPSSKAVVEFEDNGIGIRSEDMDRIFEPFFTTKPEGEGTGLGLFVSYGIVKKHGGTIECVSHEPTEDREGGTTFTVKLHAKI
ncbi:MAG: PAS domain S-box protein [Deltaproteobacteria bacterium]|nr:PAS domain S-box protein [Deltaproteobacteria bacterium]